jgi:23S rRNA (uracil1939-C5)-methyltransferase
LGRILSRELKVKIDHIGAKGDGVALIDGAPLYVPFSAAGDELEVALSVDGKAAHILRVLKPGPDRITAPCPQYGLCGGCALQHINDHAYAVWKRGLIGEALGHRGFSDITVNEIIISPPASRRRASFHCLSKGKAGMLIGFHERGSNRIAKIDGCKVLMPEIMDFMSPLQAYLAKLLSEGQKATVQVTATDSGLDVWIDCSRKLDLRLRMQAADFAGTADLARLVWGADKEILAERRAPQVHFEAVPVAIPPAAFLQATVAGEKALTGLAKQALAGAKRVADLFAGCGTFSVALAEAARVHAVEGEVDLTEALKRGVNNARGLQQVTVERRDLFRRPLLVHELNVFDGVLFDPPRAGAREQAEELAKSKVPVIVAVSCNPATFARDARILVNGGYVMGAITPVDQFLWTDHIELLAVFSKRA